MDSCARHRGVFFIEIIRRLARRRREAVLVLRVRPVQVDQPDLLAFKDLLDPRGLKGQAARLARPVSKVLPVLPARLASLEQRGHKARAGPLDPLEFKVRVALRDRLDLPVRRAFLPGALLRFSAIPPQVPHRKPKLLAGA